MKTTDAKFGNDQFCVVLNFDEMSRWILWSENEFSHNLSPEPTAVGAVHSADAGVKPRGATPLYGVPAASWRWLFSLGVVSAL